MPRFVNDEGGALGVLLGDLFSFDGGGEFGGEGELLWFILVSRVVEQKEAEYMGCPQSATRHQP